MKARTIRAKLLFTPNFLPGLKVIASYMHDRHMRGGDYFALEAPAWPDQRLAYTNVPDITTVKSDIATFDASYAIDRHLTLSAVTSYSEVGYRYTYDSDWGADLDRIGQQLRARQDLDPGTPPQLRLRRAEGPCRRLLFERGQERVDFRATQRIAFVSIGLDQLLTAPAPYGYGLPAATANYVMDLYPGRGVDIFSQFITPRKTTNKALFGDATWEFVPSLKLNLGFRWDNESQDRAVDQIVTIQTTLPNPTSVPTPLQPLIAGLKRANPGARGGRQQ